MLSIEKRLSEKNESGAALLDETKAAPSAPSSPQRMNHLDALRCLAMLNVVVAHAVTSFAVSCPSWWSSRDSIRSYVFDIIIFAIMGFTMQTFFMLSGYFTATHLKRHSLSSFAVNRYKRIVLPFVFSTILIVPLFQIINLYGSFKTNVSVNLQPGFKAAIVDFFTTKFFPYFSFGHLWFLWYLVMLYAAVMIIKHLASRYINFIYIDKVLTSVLNSPVKPFLFAIPTALLMVFMTWMIDTPFGVIPEPHILAYYGFFFFYWHAPFTPGFVLSGRDKTLAALSFFRNTCSASNYIGSHFNRFIFKWISNICFLLCCTVLLRSFYMVNDFWITWVI